MPSGYSTTPLAKKLGLKENFEFILWNEPDHYFELFSDLPSGLVRRKNVREEKADFIHLFCTTVKELEHAVPKYKKALKKEGLMWISWPKGKSEIPTNLKRDMVRTYLIGIGLVDVKVAAVDEDWSGLKFVYRKKDRW